jgi:hypothetical protein
MSLKHFLELRDESPRELKKGGGTLHAFKTKGGNSTFGCIR